MDKLKKLKNILKSMGSALIAYSGGVDSTFLCAVAKNVLKDNVLAVTAVSETYPETELADAKKYAKLLKIKHKIIYTKELGNRNFSSNPPKRCYFCKKELFSKLQNAAKRNTMSYILDASNHDDLKDYRPGTIAKKELGIRSPLQEAGLTKGDIRKYSKIMDLPTWNKPSCACLASRIPYGDNITADKLYKIEKTEDYLKKLGFKTVRVRCHGPIARIELPNKDIKKFAENDIMSKVSGMFKKTGFIYTTIDIQGFRSGSMNEVL